jgi:galactose mutarotase-like enzyme
MMTVRCLESDQLKLTVLPERGAKVASLHYRPAATELLWQPAAGVTDGPVAAGIAFDADQAWGWDEMFPAIHAEEYEAEGGRLIAVPDHGEVWTLPWELLQADGKSSVTLRVTGASLPYELTRRTAVSGATITQDYTLRNTGETELPWMWAAHPLFVLDGGAALQVPPAWDTVRNAHDSPAMPGYDRIYPYPGSGPRLDALPAPGSAVALKYFFEHENADPGARVVLSRPELCLDIEVGADPRTAPWYGVWCNAGGLFGHNNVAIEPASAPMDSLSAAARLGRLPRLPAGASVSWWMVVSITAH